MKNKSKKNRVSHSEEAKPFYYLIDLRHKLKQLYPKTNLSLYKNIVITSVLNGCEPGVR